MKKVLSLILVALVFTIFFAPAAIAEEQTLDIKWVEGPSSVAVEDMATLDLQEQFLYAGKEDTVKIMEYFGNPSSKTELGSVFPRDEKENWFIIFEYYDVGHVKDNDKDKINADDLLDSLKKGTEEANKERAKKGNPPLSIKGWLEKPNYNADLHSLVWCVFCESTNGISANYEARLLCREGYVSATLVCSDTELDKAKPYVKQVLDKFTFNQGKRYEDYVQGKDKLSDLGLAALIVGGSAVAVKKGLLIVILAFLKKGGIVLFVPIAAFFKRLFGRKKAAVPSEPQQQEAFYDTEETDSSDMTGNLAMLGDSGVQAQDETAVSEEPGGMIAETDEPETEKQ